MPGDSEHQAVQAASPFVTTHWTKVLEARGDSSAARAALSDLCAVYYAPVHAFIRANARDGEAANDLTQEFFARLLGRQGIDNVDPQHGRFRSYLLGAVKHFLADARQHAGRLKRGGGVQLQTIDAETDTSPGLQLSDPSATAPDLDFDRKWALVLLEQALAALAAEHLAAGTSTHFEELKPWLAGDPGDVSQAEAATRLGMSHGAVKVAIHRLRRRFRQTVKSEIGRTLNDPGQIDEELACLVAALGRA